MKDVSVGRCVSEIVDAVKHKHPDVDTGTRRIFAELKCPEEVIKTMTLGDPEQLMKEARFYKETLGDGRVGGEVEGGGRSITFKPAARFGSVPDRLSGNAPHQGKKQRFPG